MNAIEIGELIGRNYWILIILIFIIGYLVWKFYHKKFEEKVKNMKVIKK